MTTNNVAQSLTNFSGIARRQELRGEINGIKIIDDFGHHPTAIAATIKALKQRYPNSKIWAIFEPRSNTSRRNMLQSELQDSLSIADGVFISEVPNPEKVPDGELLDVESVVENNLYPKDYKDSSVRPQMILLIDSYPDLLR